MTSPTTNPTTNTGFALEYNQVENTKPYLKFAITITSADFVKQLAKCQNVKHSVKVYTQFCRSTTFVSSFRSSNSHPNLLLTQQQQQHPLFQITPVLNTGLSLSEPLQLYKGYNAIKRQSLDSMCWLHGCLMGSTGHH